MLFVETLFIQPLHDIARLLQVFDRFKKGNDVDIQGFFLPAIQNKKCIHFQHIQFTCAMTDNIPVASFNSIVFLDLLNSPDGFKCIFYYALVQARIGHSLYVDQAIDLLLHAQLPVIFWKYILFFGYGFQYLRMYTAILPNVKRSEMQAKYIHFVDEVINQVKK